jgi:hypothetical protein
MMSAAVNSLPANPWRPPEITGRFMGPGFEADAYPSDFGFESTASGFHAPHLPTPPQVLKAGIA